MLKSLLGVEHGDTTKFRGTKVAQVVSHDGVGLRIGRCFKNHFVGGISKRVMRGNPPALDSGNAVDLRLRQGVQRLQFLQIGFGRPCMRDLEPFFLPAHAGTALYPPLHAQHTGIRKRACQRVLSVPKRLRAFSHGSSSQRRC